MSKNIDIEFEALKIMVAILSLTCLTALWILHTAEHADTCGNDTNKAKKTIHVYGGFDGRGNSARGVDEEISYAESYRAARTYANDVEYSDLSYALDVAASPYASDLGRTSPSVEALRVQALLNAPRRSTLTAFMSDGIG